MAICDVYTASTNLSVNSTAQTPVIQLQPAATKRCWVVGLEINIGVTAAAAGNDILFVLAGNTTTTASETVGNAVIKPNDTAAAAALAAAFSAWGTAPTANSILWQKTLPMTTGSAWEFYPPLGYEWSVPVTAHNGIAMFVTCSVASSTPVYVDLVFGE